jgi:streptogramin lyase
MPRNAQRISSTNVFNRNVGIPPITGATDYYVVGAAVCDGRGNTWMPVTIPNNGRGLAVRKSDGTWNTIPAFIGGSAQDFNDLRDVSRPLAVDELDNLWIAAVNPRKGLASLNNRGSVTDSVADFYITSENGLPNDNVNCVVVDRDNDIWVGTQSGIAIVLDPSNPTRQGGIASYKPLSGISINAIAVDPLNQKWVATNEGAVLLSRDGTQSLAQHNVANTNGKIISNEIKDIAIDAKSGTVYFGTASGLVGLTTTAAQPRESFDELLVSPNPYRIPNPIPLTVDGLVENSIVKILTIDGKLVRELRTPGGRIGFWDGKDEEGNDVSSGIYIVIAYSETNKDKVGKGKVAVLKR